MDLDWQRLQAEVARVHRRYQVEVVEALTLCPWAKEARLQGRVCMSVSFMPQPDAAAALALVDEVMANDAIEVGFAVFPALRLDRLPFQHFASEVRARDDVRRARGQSHFAMADFHPHAVADVATPERLVPFFRRSPDPMLQVVRTSALEAVRHSDDQGTSFIDPTQHDLSTLLSLAPSTPSLASRVARNNARTLKRMGLQQVEALFVSILGDRNTSYAALGLTTPNWV